MDLLSIMPYPTTPLEYREQTGTKIEISRAAVGSCGVTGEPLCQYTASQKDPDVTDQWSRWIVDLGNLGYRI